VDDFLDEKVPQHYLTEKLPEDWDQKPVKVFKFSEYKKEKVTTLT